LNGVRRRITADNGREQSGEEPQVAQDHLVEEVGVRRDVLEGVDLHALAEHRGLPVFLLKIQNTTK